jgi:hypothetical protein
MTAAQDTLAAAHASWNAADLDGYLELYDDRIRLHGCSPEPMGKAEARAFDAATFAAFTRRNSTSTRCCGTARRAPSVSR